MNIPDENGRPKYDASTIHDRMLDLSRKIFRPSLLRNIFTCGGLWFPKYSTKPLDKAFKEYFKDLKLSQSISNILIPAYDLELEQTFFMSSNHKLANADYLMRDVARATSAAPTIFSASHIKNLKNDRFYSFIDGGIAVNNPALAAAIYAHQLYGDDIEIFVVSLGTGVAYAPYNKDISYSKRKNSGMIGWAPQILSLNMFAANEVVDDQMLALFNNKKSKKYLRFQTVLSEKHTSMDNIKKTNLDALENYAKEVVKRHSKDLDHIVEILMK